MLVARVSILAFLTTLAFSASVVVQRQENVQDLDSPLPSRVTSPSSLRSPSPSSPLLVHCDGNVYGRNLNVASCRDVFSHMPRGDAQVTFAERHSGIPHDIPLPWRVMSSDGKCFTQTLLAEGVTSGHASATELGRAAFTLLHTCVIEKGTGGIAANLGGDENMRIVIADYEPNVRCDRSPAPGPPFESCFHIFADMKATKDLQVFGNGGEPRVEVNLPLYYKSIDARCMIKIAISGRATSTSWYEIWAAVKAIFSICTRTQEKGGKAFRIGLRKNIFVELSDEYPDAVQTTGGAAMNVSGLDDVGAANSFLEADGLNLISTIPSSTEAAGISNRSLVSLPDVTPEDTAQTAES